MREGVEGIVATPAAQLTEALAERTPYRWWVLGNVILINFLVTGIAWNYVIMVVPQLLEDLGVAIDKWGILWSAIAFGVLVFSIPAGALGDRFGARRAVGCGVAVVGVSLLMRAVAASFTTALLAMVLFGLALGLVLANLGKAIAQWFPSDELGMANGVSQAGIGLGVGTATLATPMLLGPLGEWRGLTTVLGAVSIVLAVFWMIVVRERDLVSASTPAPARFSETLARVLSVRDMRLVALCNFLYFGGYLGALGYLPTYFTITQGMSAQTAGGIATLGAWMFIAGAILLPTLSDRIGRRKIVYVASIFVNGLVVFSEAYVLGVSLAVAAIVWGFVAGAVVLLFVVPIEMEEVGPSLAGSAIGVVNAAGFGGGVVVPLIGMALVRITPVLGFAFWAGCFIASALVFTAVRETGSRRA